MLIGKGISLRIIPVILLSLSVLSGSNLYAQNSCSQTLKEAQKSYEQGQLINIPDKLKDCMSGGFSKIEKLQAYRIIILTYLFLDEQSEAERWMNDLLVFEPDYRPNNTLDPIEFINLYNSFRVEPFISFGVMIGANRSAPRLVNNFGVANTATNPTKYTAGNNIQFGAVVDLLLYRALFLSAEGYFALRQYGSTSKVLTASEVTSTESQTWISVPLSLKYVIGKRKFKVYLRAGMAFDMIVGAQSELIRKNSDLNINEFAGPSVNMLPQRNFLNLAAFGGIGFSYKIGYGAFVIDARYYYGLTNLSNASTRYENFNQQITNYGYLDNDLGVNNIQVSVGYIYSLFRVRMNKKKTIE